MTADESASANGTDGTETGTDGVKPKDFEDALEKLETIVKELEQGELSLEASLARYEQGVSLARFCHGKLEEAEKRIEVHAFIGDAGHVSKSCRTFFQDGQDRLELAGIEKLAHVARLLEQCVYLAAGERAVTRGALVE